MLTLYKTRVRSHLEYCCPLWNPSKIGDIQILEVVRRSFTSRIHGFQHLDYWQRLKALNLMSLLRRRERYILVMIWKCLNQCSTGHCPNSLNIGFEYSEHKGKASDLPVTAVKQCTSILSPVLTLYFNHFMREGIFPDILKIGRITPIYKNKGSKLNFNNWRPISILPIFGKIFEKIIYKRLYSFLTSQNLIYSKQFGFRKGHSTSHALNHSVNFLTEAVANKKHTIGIFIDLSKAFDTIDHNKLLTKLDIYGIRGTAGALIESYISTRKQYTTFDNEKSDHEVVVYGVPQGSVLGPLLFLLYINDIVNCSTDGEFVLYADDTNIFVVGPSKAEVFRKANAVIKRVQSYMLSNLLHINTTKCHYMYFKPNIHSRNICARSQPFDQDCKLYLNVLCPVLESNERVVGHKPCN